MPELNIKPRTIFCRDNLEVLRGINDKCVDLIYIDPPFNKKKLFGATPGSAAEGAAFKDIFTKQDIKEEWFERIADKHPALFEYIKGISNIGHLSNRYYLSYMAIRLMETHRILKDTGSIYLHCDQTMGHYLRMLLDCLFGEDHFMNEIVWAYRTGGASKTTFQRKHELIFLYRKTNKATFYPLKEKSYLTGQWRHNKNKPILVNASGEQYQDILFSKTKIRVYKDAKGYYTYAGMRDVWHIDAVGRTSKERTGYPTQKPILLLERIIRASSNQGDVVLDPFCGCATTCVAAEKLERRWIGIDLSKKSYDLVRMRLAKEAPNGIWRGKLSYRSDLPVLDESFRKFAAKDRYTPHNKHNGRGFSVSEPGAVSYRAS